MTAANAATLGALFSPFAIIDRDKSNFYVRIAMAVAIGSIVFEKLPGIEVVYATERYHLVAATGVFAVAAILALFKKTSWIGLLLFTVAMVVYVSSRWPAYHNHGWLTVWTIPVAVLFGLRWWESELYRWYLRATLGIVMLAAAAQKVLAGTYFDGSFISYLSIYGAPTEQMFGFLCGDNVGQEACGWHQFIGGFIVVWQAVVGVLLLAGVRHLLFLFIEIAFLLGAGLYADEMNFQVLNIALLCIAFGYGMRPWLIVICGVLLLVDMYSLAEIARLVI